MFVRAWTKRAPRDPRSCRRHLNLDFWPPASFRLAFKRDARRFVDYFPQNLTLKAQNRLRGVGAHRVQHGPQMCDALPNAISLFSSSQRETSLAESWVRRRSADIASGDSSRMISWYSSRAKVFAICSAARFTASRPLNPKRASMSSSVALIRSACCLPSELAFRESRRLRAACCAACRTRPLSSSSSFASTVSNAGCAACRRCVRYRASNLPLRVVRKRNELCHHFVKPRIADDRSPNPARRQTSHREQRTSLANQALLNSSMALSNDQCPYRAFRRRKASRPPSRIRSI